MFARLWAAVTAWFRREREEANEAANETVQASTDALAAIAGTDRLQKERTEAQKAKSPREDAPLSPAAQLQEDVQVKATKLSATKLPAESSAIKEKAAKVLVAPATELSKELPQGQEQKFEHVSVAALPRAHADDQQVQAALSTVFQLPESAAAIKSTDTNKSALAPSAELPKELPAGEEQRKPERVAALPKARAEEQSLEALLSAAPKTSAPALLKPSDALAPLKNEPPAERQLKRSVEATVKASPKPKKVKVSADPSVAVPPSALEDSLQKQADMPSVPKELPVRKEAPISGNSASKSESSNQTDTQAFASSKAAEKDRHTKEGGLKPSVVEEIKKKLQNKQERHLSSASAFEEARKRQRSEEPSVKRPKRAVLKPNRSVEEPRVASSSSAELQGLEEEEMQNEEEHTSELTDWRFLDQPLEALEGLEGPVEGGTERSKKKKKKKKKRGSRAERVELSSVPPLSAPSLAGGRVEREEASWTRSPSRTKPESKERDNELEQFEPKKKREKKRKNERKTKAKKVIMEEPQSEGEDGHDVLSVSSGSTKEDYGVVDCKFIAENDAALGLRRRIQRNKNKALEEAKKEEKKARKKATKAAEKALKALRKAEKAEAKAGKKGSHTEFAL